MTRLAALAAALGVLLCAGRAEAQRTHTVVQGDHLWNLAKHYYTDHFRWRRIFDANTGVVEDPHWIYPGEILIIPDVEAEPDLGPALPPVEAAAPLPPPPEPEEPEEPARPPVGSLARGNAVGLDISKEMPPALTGHFDTLGRVMKPRDWKEDGRIVELEGREVMASAGDMVAGRLLRPAEPGDRFAVYRRSGLMEQDPDPRAVYLQRIGFVEVKERRDGGRYRFVILKSGDSVQLDDYLVRE